MDKIAIKCWPLGVCAHATTVPCHCATRHPTDPQQRKPARYKHVRDDMTACGWSSKADWDHSRRVSKLHHGPASVTTYDHRPVQGVVSDIAVVHVRLYMNANRAVCHNSHHKNRQAVTLNTLLHLPTTAAMHWRRLSLTQRNQHRRAHPRTKKHLPGASRT